MQISGNIPERGVYSGFRQQSPPLSRINRISRELDSILLSAYRPILLMAPSDTPPVSFTDLLRFSTLKRYLKGQAYPIIENHPTLETLSKYDAPDYFLSYNPRFIQQAFKDGWLRSKVYGKILESEHFKVLYYFYYFPTSGISRVNTSFNIHSGDAEGIQVFLEKQSLQPVGIFAFQHYGGKSLYWQEITKNGNQPVIYLERNSHASKPLTNKTSKESLKTIHYELETISAENELIFNWKGRIGSFSNKSIFSGFKETLPSVTAAYRGPVANHVSPTRIVLKLNAAIEPEKAFYQFLD